MRKLYLLLFCLFLITAKSIAQTGFEHPVITQNFIKQNKIENITFVDSFASSFSSFNYRYRSLDFSYEGLLLKSLDTYDSLSTSREMWYYYYDAQNRLEKKIARANNNDVIEAFHFQYDTLGHLIRREHKLFNADSTISELSVATFVWEGDSIRIEHDHKNNRFEIAFLNKNGEQTGLYGEYRKSYFSDGRLKEIMGVGSGFNESDLAKYRIKYQYNDNKQLTAVETYQDLTHFSYNANGFLISMIEKEIKTGKMKNRTTVLYKQR